MAWDATKSATPGEAVIGAAEAAIVMFTRAIAIEEKRYGVRANAMTPSVVYGTASTERITAADGFSSKLFDRAAQQAHLGVDRRRHRGAGGIFVQPGRGAVDRADHRGRRRDFRGIDRDRPCR